MLLSCVVLYLYLRCVHTASVSAQFEDGVIIGDWRDGVSSFLGVPYAEAPTGNRRFARSKMIRSIRSNYTAHVRKPLCVQDVEKLKAYWCKNGETSETLLQGQVSEDCLYMDIYTPVEYHHASLNIQVVVYFTNGIDEGWVRQHLSLRKMVKTKRLIAVSVNYRIGALGFWNGTHLGLEDQRLALQWVKRNIASFGGSAKNVTVFSAGIAAETVYKLSTTSAANGLIGAVILHLPIFETFYQASDKTETEFAERINCSEFDIGCLRNVTVNQILTAEQGLSFRVQIETTVPHPEIRYFISFASGFISFSHILESQAVVTELLYRDRIRLLSERLDIDHQKNKKFISDVILHEFKSFFNGNISANSTWKATYANTLNDYNVYQIKRFLNQSFKRNPRMIQVYLIEGTILEQAPSIGRTCSFASKDAMRDYLTTIWTNFIKNEVVPSNKNPHKSEIHFENSGTPRSVWLEHHQTFWSDYLEKVVEDPVKQCTLNTTPNNRKGEMKVDLKVVPVVTIQQGTMLGARRSDTAQTITWDEYKGIPYAEPPLGNLRWRPPVPHRGWTGVRDATVGNSTCPQVDVFVEGEQTEDCLHMDVYTPPGAHQRRADKMAVMAYIHGGSLMVGEKTSFTGAALCQHGIILVTINYRLGILGLLSTGDEAASGNWALLDQQLAIKWVKDNIEQFGGDPQRITVAGQSAGASSVIFQMLSPKNKGLFQRTIALSGSAMATWAIDRKGEVNSSSRYILRQLNCGNGSTHQMVQCLRAVSHKDLVETVVGVNMDDIMTIQSPVVDGNFLPRYPERLYEDGQSRDKQLITGYTAYDGFPYTSLVSDGKVPSLGKWQGGVAYRYVFNYKTSWSFFSPERQYLYDFVKGVHGDELPLVFGIPLLPQEFQSFWGEQRTFREEEVNISKHLVTTFTNFVKTGNPNEGDSLDGYEWHKYTEKLSNTFEMGNKYSNMGENCMLTSQNAPDKLRSRNISFWINIIMKPNEDSSCAVDITPTGVVYPSRHGENDNTMNVVTWAVVALLICAILAMVIMARKLCFYKQALNGRRKKKLQAEEEERIAL